MTQQQDDRTCSADVEGAGDVIPEEGEGLGEFPSLGHILTAVCEQLTGALRQI
ncbi:MULTISPECIES: hypothetical protein [unclassified Streptomyces]|uniref:hypothetical protein n=1 Tax=unclassified Streptomyces TaxID=2593676 RepID=UPI0024413893|nr:hypothetical protein [Streptomyces sp. DH41]MDG9722064.1 hypothetical protein [Streptomyces sp. DH41]